MAIAAFELHHRAGWSATNQFRVQRVIQLDRAGIGGFVAAGGTHDRKFRVAVVEAMNGIRVI